VRAAGRVTAVSGNGAIWGVARLEWDPHPRRPSSSTSPAASARGDAAARENAGGGLEEVEARLLLKGLDVEEVRGERLRLYEGGLSGVVTAAPILDDAICILTQRGRR
jgi:hypothetical protein